MRTYAGQLAWIAGFISVVVSGIPSPAQAGPVEQFVQVLWNAAKPDRLVLRYDNAGGGLVVSEDGGKTFALVCAAATGTADLRASTGFMDGDGRIWLAQFDGLAHDDGTVCEWTRDPSFAGVWTVEIAPHPSRPDVKFAITSPAEPMLSGLYRSEGQGAFAPLGALDDARPTRLRIARRGDGLRFYESAVRATRMVDLGGGPTLVANYVIRYSDDDGAHWTEHAFPTSEGSVRLEAVDPTRAERIVVSVGGSAQTTLYVSSDAGASFAPYLTLAAMGGIAFTPEGRVYIGDAGDITGARRTRGLWVAETLDSPAQLLTDAYTVQCLAYRASDSTLFVCERYAFGVADLQTGALSQRVDFANLERMVECSDRDVRAQCRAQLLDGYCNITHFPCAPVCDAYGTDLSDIFPADDSDPSLAACFARRHPGSRPAASDAGAADAGEARGTVADAGADKHVAAGCSASRRSGRTGRGWLLVAAAGVIWVVRLRKRRG